MFNIILYIPEKKINNENSTKVDLEYVYMDVLNYKNMMEEQPTIYTNNSVKGNFFIRHNCLLIIFLNKYNLLVYYYS